MLRAYFDDSGESEQAVGGCLASEQSWESLDPAWGAALDDSELKWFHAKDFENARHRDYAHLSRADRDALFDRLLRLIAEHIRPPIGAYICLILPKAGVEMSRERGKIDRASHRKGKRRRTEWERWVDEIVGLYHDPYSICLGQCLRWLLDHCGIGPDNQVHVFLAHQENHTAKGARVYKMATRISRWRALLSGLSNGREMNPRCVRPLQVADFAAYYLAKFYRKSDARAARAGKTLSPVFIDCCRALSVSDGWPRED